MTASPDTLPCCIRQAALLLQTASHVLGVDDWVKREGYDYGKILAGKG